MHRRYIIADSSAFTYLGLLWACSSGDGGVTIKHGSFWTTTSGCRCIVCLFCRRSLHESEARPSRLRRRPLVPRFCRVPIDGNRKLHAMPECAVKRSACNRVAGAFRIACTRFREPRPSANSKADEARARRIDAGDAPRKRFDRTRRVLARFISPGFLSFLFFFFFCYYYCTTLSHVYIFRRSVARAMSHPAERRSRMRNESRRVLTHVRAATLRCHAEETATAVARAITRRSIRRICSAEARRPGRLYRSESRRRKIADRESRTRSSAELECAAKRVGRRGGSFAFEKATRRNAGVRSRSAVPLSCAHCALSSLSRACTARVYLAVLFSLSLSRSRALAVSLFRPISPRPGRAQCPATVIRSPFTGDIYAPTRASLEDRDAVFRGKRRSSRGRRGVGAGWLDSQVARQSGQERRLELEISKAPSRSSAPRESEALAK